MLTDVSSQDPSTLKALFEEMVQISLWGNASDLSLLASVSIEELDSVQGQKAREASRSNVLVDDTSSIFSLLTDLKSTDKHAGEIHYVLDNAGFELLTDLVFASFLLTSGITERVHLHGKRIPWFVSDVTSSDLKDLLDGFTNGTLYPDLSTEDQAELKEAAAHWQDLFSSGKLVFEAHPFWTTAHLFGRLPVVAPDLYQTLEQADLVIYKGDLNYRKLTYDALWPHSTPFEDAIGPLKNGPRTLVLRTAKAEVAVGVPEEKLRELPEDWTSSGKWGLVQYWDGKKGNS